MEPCSFNVDFNLKLNEFFAEAFFLENGTSEKSIYLVKFIFVVWIYFVEFLIAVSNP